MVSRILWHWKGGQAAVSWYECPQQLVMLIANLYGEADVC